MNLEILTLLDSYVHWRLDGLEGNSFINDGKVHDAHLCYMKPDTVSFVKAKVQEWLDTPPDKSPDKLTNALANAIIDMEDHGYSECLGPNTERASEAWNALVLEAEEVADRKTDEHRGKR
jgi:hypothetical protein